MHRTGTSLVAGLLQRHGVWLGDEADIMRPNPYNPDGYFENDRLVEIDDAVLALFGGTWKAPPSFPENWTGDPRLDGVKARAVAVRDSLAAKHRVWGFKDPRAALTLPFWRSVFGVQIVVVTLRNPLETAQSLARRDDMGLEQGIALWAAHYRAILAHTNPARMVVVGYEAFCADPVASARALLSRLPGLGGVDAEAARASVRSSLRHFRVTPSDLVAAGISSEIRELYADLSNEAVNADVPVDDDGATGMSGLDLAIRDVHVEVQRLAAKVARLENEIGFIRTADLAGIAAHLKYQRDLLERIALALPPLGERVSSIEAARELAVKSLSE